MYKTEDEMYAAKKNEMGAFVAKTVSLSYQVKLNNIVLYNIKVVRDGILKCIMLKI